MLCKTEKDAAEFIRKTAEYELISGIIWIIIAIIQICTCYCVVAGVWNIFVAVSRFKSIARVKARDPEIPKEEEDGLTSLIIVGVVNLIFGGVIGIACVCFDYFVRGRIMENKHVFNGIVLSESESGTVSEESDTASLLTRLARLHQQGALSDEEFNKMKQQLLNNFR
jgi:hypothetical protein